MSVGGAAACASAAAGFGLEPKIEENDGVEDPGEDDEHPAKITTLTTTAAVVVPWRPSRLSPTVAPNIPFALNGNA